MPLLSKLFSYLYTIRCLTYTCTAILKHNTHFTILCALSHVCPFCTFQASLKSTKGALLRIFHIQLLIKIYVNCNKTSQTTSISLIFIELHWFLLISPWFFHWFSIDFHWFSFHIPEFYNVSWPSEGIFQADFDQKVIFEANFFSTFSFFSPFFGGGTY